MHAKTVALHDSLLVSLRPESVADIFSGKITYIFRRMLPMRTVGSLLICKAAPERRIVGEAVVLGIFRMPILELWLRMGLESGLSKARFWQYFSGLRYGTAVEIWDPIRYPQSVPLKDAGLSVLPQSFRYLSLDVTNSIRSLGGLLP